ncbi:hypothetical protein GJAV_G00248670 [Gymnothorax javanicus]|nr:hypothetical protein GJAV_G00248670 [Gymnothorax javanicus]
MSHKLYSGGRVPTEPIMAQAVHPAMVCMFSSPVGLPMEGEAQPALAVPQLVMLANVALNAEGTVGEYGAEEKQMVELTTVGSGNYTYSDEEEYEEEEDSLAPYDEFREHGGVQSGNLCSETPLLPNAGAEEKGNDEGEQGSSEGEQRKQALPGASPAGKRKRGALGPAPLEDPRRKKPLYCKPCQYQAESEEDFLRHIRVHGDKMLAAVVTAAEGEELREKAAGEPDVGATVTEEEAGQGKGVIWCERCGYNTNRYDHYRAHLKHHNKEGSSQRVYKCTTCSYTTVSHYHWKKHLRNHFPSKLYTCSDCNYFSDRKNNYIQHIRTHTGERPFQCPCCQYTSSQKTHLIRHMRTHSGEKPFKCDTCSYVAANRHEVTRHIRQVHGGPKPLSCPHCPYNTADRSNYKKHVELHVNPRQFMCPVCCYAASKKCNLQYHLKSRHPDSPDVTMDVSKVRLRVKNPDLGPVRNASWKKARRDILTRIPEEEGHVNREHGGQEGEGEHREKMREEDENCEGPINLTMKRARKIAIGQIVEKDGNKQSISRDREMKILEKERLEKREEHKGDKMEKPGDHGKLQRRKERIRGKAAKVCSEVRMCGVEKQGQTEAVQSEQGMGQETEGMRKPVGRKSVKRRPKRGQKLVNTIHTSDTIVEPEGVGSSGVSAVNLMKKEMKKDNKTGRKRTRAMKIAAKTDENVADEMVVPPEAQDDISKENQKNSKTKVDKRKRKIVETSVPGTDVGKEPTSAMPQKRRRLEDSSNNQKPVKVLRGHKTVKCKNGQSEKAGAKKPLNKLLEVPDEEPGMEDKEPNTIEDAGSSFQEDVSLDAEFRLVLEEEPEDQVQECSVTLPGSWSKVEEPESGRASMDTPLEAEDPADEVDCSAAEDKSLGEGASGPESTLDGCVNTKEPLTLSSLAPVAPRPWQVRGKKVLTPLELPQTGKNPIDAEEDEGIHSPDGSDMSDSVSEGSDDSGLNGNSVNSTPTDAPEALHKLDMLTEDSCAQSDDGLLPAEKSPAFTEESSSLAEKVPAPIHKDPTPSGIASAPVNEGPSPNEKSLMLVDTQMENQSPIDVDQTSTKKNSSSVGVDCSSSVLDHSPLRGSSSVVNIDLSPIDRDSSTIDSRVSIETDPAPNKDSPSLTETSNVPVKEGHIPDKLKSHTCIFCDRTFPIELDYRRHLNRHLVNVYYLESAVSE